MIREQADFDQGNYDPSELHGFDKQEFSDRGKADLKIRPNDPRFADNPLKDDQLDEFAGPSPIDRLHQMFSHAGISDQQLRGGISLTQIGTNKVAARLGIGPADVAMYINSLVQQLRKDDASSLERLTELYYAEAGEPTDPFSEGRYSYEPDALGSVTVRDAATGRSSFIQGAKANRLVAQLKSRPNDEDAILAPLVEDAHDASDDFSDEINAKAGTYNFTWQLGVRHGTGTVMFQAEGSPKLRLVAVRDADGNDVEIDADPAMRHALQQQARDFIGRE